MLITTEASIPHYLRSLGLKWDLSPNDCENLFLNNNYKIDFMDEGNLIVAIAPDKSVQFALLFMYEKLCGIDVRLPES